MNKFEQYLIDNHVESIGKPPPNLRKIFPEGCVLFDVRYRKHPHESFEVVYLDPDTKKLQVKYIPAIVDIWFTKPEYRYVLDGFCVDPYFRNKMRNQHKPDDAYQMPQIELKKAYRVFCKVSQIPKMIYQHAGKAKMYSEDGSHLIDKTYAEFYEENSEGLYSFGVFNKRMCQNPWSFKADFQPDSYFRIAWLHEFSDSCDVSQVTCGFIDIEVDVLDGHVDLSDPNDVRQPVSVVTSIYKNTKKVYVDILQPRPKNMIDERFHGYLEKQQIEYDWIKSHQDEFISMLYGNPSTNDCPVEIDTDKENLKYLNDGGYDIKLLFWETNDKTNFQRAEALLINSVYEHVYENRPMFMFAWNAPFDFNYLPNRAQWLGYDLINIVVPMEFESREYHFEKDRGENTFDMKNNRDWFYSSTYTQYLCQERLYAGVRKSQSEEPSYRLTAIGDKVAGIRKLTDTKSGRFDEFSYTDYIKYILYNVRDVVIQLAIESKVNDAQTLYSRSYMFSTAYSKCFQETHIVRNSKEQLFEEFQFVMSNKTVVDKTIDGSFQGAYVADPAKNKPTGLVSSGRAYNCIIYGASDLDAAAMYPNQKMAYNKDKLSLIYKCKIDNDLFRNGICYNKSYNQTYEWKDSKNRLHQSDMCGPIFNSFKNHNYMSLCSNWFNLPLITDMVQSVRKDLII